MRAAATLLCSIAAALGIAAMSRAPFAPPAAGDALLRFSWRMNVAARESCRSRTQQELDALPMHMRTPQVCTRDAGSYVLITTVDGGATDTIPITRGGVRGDRPIFVTEDRRLEPGRHRIVVEMQRTGAAGMEQLARLDTVLTLRQGRIELITLDAAGRLVLQSSR